MPRVNRIRKRIIDHCVSINLIVLNKNITKHKLSLHKNYQLVKPW